MDALLQHWMKNEHVDYDIKKAEIAKIRWNSCRHCLHLLSCKCSDSVCQNRFDEIWHIIFFSYTGKLRQDFQLHRKCAFIVMRKLGTFDEFKSSGQLGFEKFLEIKLDEPEKNLQKTSSQVSTLQRNKGRKFCKGCEIWLEIEPYKNHMLQHYRESSTDVNIEKQYFGVKEKKIEIIGCEIHGKRAIFLPTGEHVCPVVGCNEELKKKMMTIKDGDDYLICLFHQSKITYDTNSGLNKCPVNECNSTDWIKKSYLLSMFREGYIIYHGQKIEIDVESRTVELDGQKILLKV